ncbi:MAG: hypothetical protein HY241_16380 [Actinobacteria bacterium]|nr:hypothetical protein [Actinomycetota bacterium]
MTEDELRPMVLIGHPSGDRVMIRVLGRLRGGVDDYWDGNWLVSPVEIVAGGFTANVGASLRAEEFHAFREAVQRLNAELRGEAVLESMEGWLSLVVRVVSSGRLTVMGKAIDRLGGGNQLLFRIDDLDQSYLLGIIEALDEVEAFFPVVGTCPRTP